MRAVLDPALDFRALTPGKFWEASSAGRRRSTEIVLGHWFEPTDTITAVTSLETGVVAPATASSYRLAVTNGDGDHVVEQQAYYETDGDRITWLRILCAGFLPA